MNSSDSIICHVCLTVQYQISCTGRRIHNYIHRYCPLCRFFKTAIERRQVIKEAGGFF